MSFFKNVRTANAGGAAERICLYGTGGVGKTSAAVSFPKAVVLPIEDGLDALPHVPRFDPAPTKWEDVEAVLDEFIAGAGQLPYKTLVIDTMDALEQWCWDYTCAHNYSKKKWESLETPGYGKGYSEANKVWRTRFFPRLDRLHARGIHIVLIAHSMLLTFKNPRGEDFDRYTLKMHKAVSKLTYEWVSDMFFCEHYTGVAVSKTKGGAGPTKAMGQSTSERIARTVWDAAWDAKHRIRVPDEIVMPDPDEGSFYDALQLARQAPREGRETESAPDDSEAGEKASEDSDA